MNRQEIEAEIRKSLAMILNKDVSDVPIDQNLSDEHGLDSLDRLLLLSEVEDRLDVTFYDADTDKASTIRGMLEICESAIRQSLEPA